MTVWHIDPAHTDVGFSVKHMMVSKVKGSFVGIQGQVEGDPLKLEDAKISLEIDPSTINTNQEARDDHLRSEDFFHVDEHPTIAFKSTEIKETKEDEYDVIGDLTVKGVTKPTTFRLERTGNGVMPSGLEVVGFEGTTSISRKEFGLTWNQALETGGVLVGDDININVDVQVNPAK